MALEQRLNLNLKQTLTLRMTPQLRQAIKILQVSRPELEQMIADELCQNPTLEETEGPVDEQEFESRTGDVEKAESEPTPEVKETSEEGELQANEQQKVDWEEYLERHSGDFHGSVGTGSDRDDNRSNFFENAADSTDSLTDTLLDQLNLVMMSDEERRIGTFIIHNLNEDGYLSCSREELVFMAECPIETLDEVREIIQEFEPPGSASVDLRECLLTQLKLIGYEADDYVVLIVDGYLKDLESRRYDKIAKALNVDVAEVIEAHSIIRGLEPKPGRNYGDRQAAYITPDVYIHRVGDEFVVTLNDEGLPHLQVNPYYKTMMKDSQSPGETKGYLQDKVRSASWLIKSIEQRQRTLRKVTESIVRFQREFLLHGIEHLKPMVLKDVANDISMHESTVSRATANKYVHTSRGLFELKYFFTSSLKGTDGTDISSESVKSKIQEIISAEDPGKPLSDQIIVKELAKDHIDIARRTVAKYREMLGILPSSKRKRYVVGG